LEYFNQAINLYDLEDAFATAQPGSGPRSAAHPEAGPGNPGIYITSQGLRYSAGVVVHF
jgi:hypothetical protein